MIKSPIFIKTWGGAKTSTYNRGLLVDDYSINSWTVPYSAWYMITALGASGMIGPKNSSYTTITQGGVGAEITILKWFDKGTQLRIAPGRTGTAYPKNSTSGDVCSGPGGGSSSVWMVMPSSATLNNIYQFTKGGSQFNGEKWECIIWASGGNGSTDLNYNGQSANRTANAAKAKIDSAYLLTPSTATTSLLNGTTSSGTSTSSPSTGLGPKQLISYDGKPGYYSRNSCYSFGGWPCGSAQDDGAGVGANWYCNGSNPNHNLYSFYNGEFISAENPSVRSHGYVTIACCGSELLDYKLNFIENTKPILKSWVQGAKQIKQSQAEQQDGNTYTFEVPVTGQYLVQAQGGCSCDAFSHNTMRAPTGVNCYFNLQAEDTYVVIPSKSGVVGAPKTNQTTSIQLPLPVFSNINGACGGTSWFIKLFADSAQGTYPLVDYTGSNTEPYLVAPGAASDICFPVPSLYNGTAEKIAPFSAATAALYTTSAPQPLSVKHVLTNLGKGLLGVETGNSGYFSIGGFGGGVPIFVSDTKPTSAQLFLRMLPDIQAPVNTCYAATPASMGIYDSIANSTNDFTEIMYPNLISSNNMQSNNVDFDNEDGYVSILGPFTCEKISHPENCTVTLSGTTGVSSYSYTVAKPDNTTTSGTVSGSSGTITVPWHSTINVTPYASTGYTINSGYTSTALVKENTTLGFGATIKTYSVSISRGTGVNLSYRTRASSSSSWSSYTSIASSSTTLAINHGTEINFSASAQSGYNLSSTPGGGVITGNTSYSFTATGINISADITLNKSVSCTNKEISRSINTVSINLKMNVAECSAGTTIATIPSGYRPISARTYTATWPTKAYNSTTRVYYYGGTTNVTITVNTNGTITASAYCYGSFSLSTTGGVGKWTSGMVTTTPYDSYLEITGSWTV